MEQIGRDRREFWGMEQQKSNRTITIKINGNERKYKEVTRNVEVESQPEILESARSTELDGFSEVAATQHTADESFDWILPNDDYDKDEIEEYIIAKQPIEKKKNNSISTLKKSLQKKQHSGPIKSLLFSILLAIVIGTSFGFLVLKLVINEAKVGVDQVTTIPQDPTTEKENPVGATGALKLQPINTYIVQGGVFSSVESAEVGAELVKQKGVPVQIIEANGQAFLFLGLADSIDKAKAIGTSLKENDIEVFAKAYTLPEKDVKELTSTETKLLKEIEVLYQSLSSLASSAMLSESIDENVLLEQKDFLLSIDKKEIKSSKIEQLRLELSGSIENLSAYNQQKNKSLVIEAQQHLLSFIGTYYTL
jgi:stage II sporulation protein B